jgi:hypothetical protein
VDPSLAETVNNLLAEVGAILEELEKDVEGSL